MRSFSEAVVRRCSVKTVFITSFQNSRKKKTLLLESLFDKVTDQAPKSLKKRLQYRCFLVDLLTMYRINARSYIHKPVVSYIKENYWTHCKMLLRLLEKIVAMNLSCVKTVQYRRNSRSICNLHVQAKSPPSLPPSQYKFLPFRLCSFSERGKLHLTQFSSFVYLKLIKVWLNTNK